MSFEFHPILLIITKFPVEFLKMVKSKWFLVLLTCLYEKNHPTTFANEQGLRGVHKKSNISTSLITRGNSL